MRFANVVPRAISPIEWGWKNSTIDVDAPGLPKKMTFVSEPLGAIEMPDLTEHFDFSSLVIEQYAPGKPLGTQNFKSIFTTAARFLGYERLLAEMPSLHRITFELARWNRFLLLAAKGLRLQHFLVGDDIAGNTGLMMSRFDFEKWLLSQYAVLVNVAWEFGLEAGFHSDGDIFSILPLLRDAGFKWISYQPVGRMASLSLGSPFLGMEMIPVEDQARENEETLRLQRGGS